MELTKRYCVQYLDGTVECFRDGFWYSDTGIIVKWAILASFFLFFMAWFLGGYLHAKARLRKGKPLLAYHRWLVSYQDRKRYGQTTQNRYEYYAQPPYPQQQQQQQQQAYGPRPDGTWPEPPPMYNGDAPPGYVPPPGASKMDPNQAPGNVEMGQYPPPPPMGAQQTGGQSGFQQEMPPRPAQARLAGLLGRFRK
ncbi:uncharacterized protein CC84DRAFT_1215339 [Paraphaeosphaeria sporulosa]|uniref:Ubiquitin-protein ligase sel1 n=1 Tax=Paraphaeosphaeria sporulosa TaxID=1460663 RepID=A0A177CQ52_9PLEO|nr:uncharacterized protein CC84DRAFT_1215339 [Paraphaeosphaeria sporulosa]OAG08877.1 hypothetical protein CC84DRAFT_1215339 [Paraphaeosphaeria sporulosa]